MTLPALHFCVAALQRVTGAGVVEVLLSIFPNNQCKLPAIVLAVASGARLRRLLTHDPGMKSTIVLQAHVYGGMTAEAFGIAGLVAELMTIQAFRQSFKLGVCL